MVYKCQGLLWFCCTGKISGTRFNLIEMLYYYNKASQFPLYIFKNVNWTFAIEKPTTNFQTPNSKLHLPNKTKLYLY